MGVVTLMCGDAGDAEDSVQEALARACEQEERGVRIENLAAWVTTVASNHSRTRFRSRSRERRALLRMGPRLDPPAEPGAAADALAVQRAVAALPMRQRQAVALRYFLGLDVAETARELGISGGTVKALLYQGRHRLAEALAEPDEPARFRTSVEIDGPTADQTPAPSPAPDALIPLREVT